jgi:hypothetical protein
MPLEEEDVVVV